MKLDGKGDANWTRARRDGKGTDTVRGRERTGTGWERDVNVAGAERDGNGAGRGLNGTERERDGMERWAGTGREWVMDGKILQWNHKW